MTFEKDSIKRAIKTRVIKVSSISVESIERLREYGFLVIVTSVFSDQLIRGEQS